MDLPFPSRPHRLRFEARDLNRRRMWFSLCLAGVLCLAPLERSARAEEIDRLIAVVNGSVITQSDLRLARNLNALLSIGRKSPDQSLEEEIQRLIDLEILRQELQNFPAVQIEPNEIDAELENLRQAFAEIGGMPALLNRLGLLESELREYVTLQLTLMKFVRFRFEPFVNIPEAAVRAYYEQELLPELRKTPGSPIPRLEEIAEKIEHLLKQREVDAAREKWLKEVRGISRIEVVSQTKERFGGFGS